VKWIGVRLVLLGVCTVPACGGDIEGSGNTAIEAGADLAVGDGGGVAGGVGRAGAGATAGRGGMSPAAGSGRGGSSGTGAAGSAGTAADAGAPEDAAIGEDSGQPEPGGEPAVRFVGRTDRREAGVVRFAWSGSGILFRFSGTSAAVRMDDPAGFYTRVVDGVEQPELQTTPGERSYAIAGGLSDGEHQVELYRRTEAFFGVTRFYDVDLAGGELLAPPPAKSRQLEVIGDSITAGYGNEGTVATCPFEAATENHWLTYAALSARELDADLVTIAWSGKGVIYNYGDDRNEPLPALYSRALPEDAQSHWDFARWQPDVVAINLGTNDFSTDGDPTQQEFVAAYRALLETLRAKYPNAWIMCLVPTLLGGDDLTAAEAYITEAADARTAAGDDRVVVRALEFATDGTGCDYHPSLATHANMAAALTSELRDLVGW
jgi:lysophospholipase L1-like esterase